MPNVKYRPHRGMLDDAMKEMIWLTDFECLVAHLEVEDAPWLYCMDPADVATADNTKVEYYCYDDRIKWNTWIVTVNGKARGFTDGPLLHRDSKL